jgi:hypothetical protein
MEAVRNLIYVVPLDGSEYHHHHHNHHRPHDSFGNDDTDYDDDEESAILASRRALADNKSVISKSFPSAAGMWSFLSNSGLYSPRQRVQEPGSPHPSVPPSTTTGSITNSTNNNNHPSSPEETASQLAEGTLRAYRDLALDEAVELHASLRYVSDRLSYCFWTLTIDCE